MAWVLAGAAAGEGGARPPPVIAFTGPIRAAGEPVRGDIVLPVGEAFIWKTNRPESHSTEEHVMTRIENAIQFRDHAVSILRQHSSYQGDGGGCPA